MLLRVVAIRHAKPKSEGFADEKLRTLSEEGISMQRIVTQHLEALGIRPDIIFSSPLIRAMQTAQIISEHFNDTPIVTIDALGYDFDSEKILDVLPEISKNKTAFLVGHTPTLGDMVNDLVGEVVLPAGLSKSGAAVIDFRATPEFGNGEFSGYYTPQSKM